MFGVLYGYGIILQALAVYHWIRRRPDNYWLWIILIGGGLGAVVYLLAEALPDLALLSDAFKGVSRRRRIQALRTVILDNPAPGNYEELGDLCRDEGKFREARDCYEKAITPRTTVAHPYYGRALCCLDLGDFPAAAADLAKVVQMDPGYDYNRAYGLYALALGKCGEMEKAGRAFQEALKLSTLSETQYNYACFLSMQGHADEARQITERLLSKKATLPRYLKRRERPWFRKAAALLKQLRGPAPANAAHAG